MTCEKEASPSINSASPGAFGSTDTAGIVGEAAAKSTTTTFALRAIRRAIVNAVNVILSLEAVPRTVILRAAAPAWRKWSATPSISVNPLPMSGSAAQETGAGSATDAGTAAAATRAG